jgi:hypothetical protein
LAARATPSHQVNKRVRKAAWREARALIQEGEAGDRAALSQWRAVIAKRAINGADVFYGADKYGRDVKQSLVVPLYTAPPYEPEHGFRFIGVSGKRRHLWHEGKWVELSSALMRDVGNGDLRVSFSLACAFQEARHWYGSVLEFRDQTMQVERGTESEREVVIRV